MSSLNKIPKKGTGNGIYFHLKLLYVLIFAMVVVISYNFWFQYSHKHEDIELKKIFMEISRFLKSPDMPDEAEDLKTIRTEILEFLAHSDINVGLSKLDRGKRHASESRSGEVDVSVSIVFHNVYVSVFSVSSYTIFLIDCVHRYPTQVVFTFHISVIQNRIMVKLNKLANTVI